MRLLDLICRRVWRHATAWLKESCSPKSPKRWMQQQRRRRRTSSEEHQQSTTTKLLQQGTAPRRLRGGRSWSIFGPVDTMLPFANRDGITQEGFREETTNTSMSSCSSRPRSAARAASVDCWSIRVSECSSKSHVRLNSTTLLCKLCPRSLSEEKIASNKSSIWCLIPSKPRSRNVVCRCRHGGSRSTCAPNGSRPTRGLQTSPCTTTAEAESAAVVKRPPPLSTAATAGGTFLASPFVATAGTPSTLMRWRS